MTDRLQELRARALAADVDPISDPAELSLLSVRAHMAQTFGVLDDQLPAKPLSHYVTLAASVLGWLPDTPSLPWVHGNADA